MIFKFFKNNNIDVRLAKDEIYVTKEYVMNKLAEQTEVKLHVVKSVSVVVRDNTPFSYRVTAEDVAALNDGKKIKLVAIKAVESKQAKSAQKSAAPRKKSAKINGECKIVPHDALNPINVNNGFKLGRVRVTFCGGLIVAKKKGRPERRIRLDNDRFLSIYRGVNDGKLTSWHDVMAIISGKEVA